MHGYKFLLHFIICISHANNDQNLMTKSGHNPPVICTYFTA